MGVKNVRMHKSTHKESVMKGTGKLGIYECTFGKKREKWYFFK